MYGLKADLYAAEKVSGGGYSNQMTWQIPDTPTATYEDVQVVPSSSVEGSDPVMPQAFEYSVRVLFPADAIVTQYDEFAVHELNGTVSRYKVEGKPKAHRHFFTGWCPGLWVYGKDAEGGDTL